MKEYERLNLPQLLDLMHDLVEPEAVAWTPQTVGWLQSLKNLTKNRIQQNR